MDQTAFVDLQEALIWFFGPIVVNGLFVLLAGAVLSAIGAVVLEAASRATR